MIIPVGYAQVIHYFGGAALNREAAVVYGVQLTGSVGGDERVIDLHDNFADTIMPQLNGNLSLIRTALKYGPNNVGPSWEFSATQAGGISGTVAPPNVAFLLEKTAALGGRQNRGRMYLPGVSSSDFDGDGDVGSTRLTGLNGAATSFLAGLDTITAPMVILHNTASDPTPVTGINVDSRLATQRRRLR